MDKILKFATDWKNGLALLIALGLAVWLNPLPPIAIVTVIIVCLAVVHIVAAAVRAITGGARKAE